MLTMYQRTSEQLPSTNALEEFSLALKKYPEQIFVQDKTDINEVLRTHDAFQTLQNPMLTASQIWQGEKNKGQNPQIYTYPILVATVIESTRAQTSNGEKYERLSIQPSWLTGNLVIVKEETHANDDKMTMTFLGRPVDMAQAKKHLLPVILDEIFNKGSEKAKKILPTEMDQKEASDYLFTYFETIFSQEEPALFHVQQGVEGEEENPLETWTLVRLTPPPDESEKKILDDLRKKIASSPSIKLYLETLKALGKASENKKFGM